jgi:hypothetical protein
MKSEEKRFSATLVVRHPPRLSPLIDRAAERKCMTASEYVRQSIVERLKLDGFELGGEARDRISRAVYRPSKNQRQCPPGF